MGPSVQVEAPRRSQRLSVVCPEFIAKEEKDIAQDV